MLFLWKMGKEVKWLALHAQVEIEVAHWIQWSF